MNRSPFRSGRSGSTENVFRQNSSDIREIKGSDPLKHVELYFVDQGQLCPQFSLRKTLAVIPHQIGFRQIKQLTPLVLSKRHYLIDRVQQVLVVHATLNYPKIVGGVS